MGFPGTSQERTPTSEVGSLTSSGTRLEFFRDASCAPEAWLGSCEQLSTRGDRQKAWILNSELVTQSQIHSHINENLFASFGSRHHDQPSENQMRSMGSQIHEPCKFPCPFHVFHPPSPSSVGTLLSDTIVRSPSFPTARGRTGWGGGRGTSRPPAGFPAARSAAACLVESAAARSLRRSHRWCAVQRGVKAVRTVEMRCETARCEARSRCDLAKIMSKNNKTYQTSQHHNISQLN